MSRKTDAQYEQELLAGRERLAALRRMVREQKAAMSSYGERTEADRVEAHRERHRSARLDALNALCPDRRCTACGQVKAKSRSWAIFEARHVAPVQVSKLGLHVVRGFAAVCRSCAMLHLSNAWGRGASRQKLKAAWSNEQEEVTA